MIANIDNHWESRFARLEEEGCIEHAKKLLAERRENEILTRHPYYPSYLNYFIYFYIIRCWNV